MRPRSTEGLVYGRYQVLIGHYWIDIDLSTPFASQIRGMRGYRIYYKSGELAVESTIHREG